jgi:diguanylate cyclase (GGDEF)-like protein
VQGKLRGLEVPEERALAGRLAGLLYLVGAATVILILALPGINTRHWPIVLGLAGAGALWGLLCVTRFPWERAGPILTHFSSAVGLAITALAMACTGGATSPARFYLFFVVFYCAYFYRSREAATFFVGCIAVEALPLLYDPAALQGPYLGELLVVSATYLVIGYLVLAGKRRLLELRDHARDLSLCDPLTGLKNRRALIEILGDQLSSNGSQRASDAFGLLMLDLDGFKQANTLYGHPGGDQVLRETATALRSAAREHDIVARLGGDEFAIVARGISEQAMGALAKRVLTALREADGRLSIPGFRLSASVGWALYPDNGKTVDHLIAAADLCVRGAKLSGKDRALSPLDWPEQVPVPG